METQILKCLNFDMKHPKPTDFLERFSKVFFLTHTHIHILCPFLLQSRMRKLGEWTEAFMQSAHLLQAAKLETTERIDLKYTQSYAITLFFADNAFLDETLPHTLPSLVAAASIMCTLRVLGRADWSKQLEYYTTYSRKEVAGVADKLIANGRDTKATALGLKYTSRRLGGKGAQVGADGKTQNDGCLHIIKAYYERTAPAQQQPPAAAPLPQTHTAYV
jgi:hypothetical protein